MISVDFCRLPVTFIIAMKACQYSEERERELETHPFAAAVGYQWILTVLCSRTTGPFACYSVRLLWQVSSLT